MLYPTVYAEKYIGFWLAFTLPTILFIFCPLVLIAFKSKYTRRPPTGSVLGKATGLFFLALKKNGYKFHSKGGFVSNSISSYVVHLRYYVVEEATADVNGLVGGGET